jgi:hypothetical protein
MLAYFEEDNEERPSKQSASPSSSLAARRKKKSDLDSLFDEAEAKYTDNVDFDALFKGASERHKVKIAAEDREKTKAKLAWLAGVLVLPPVSGYLLLFLVLPWVVRGFASPTKRPPASVS